MTFNFTKIDKGIIAAALLVTATLAQEHILLLAILPFSALLFFAMGKRAIFIFVLVLLMALSYEIGLTARLLINIFAFTALISFYFSEYGFSFAPFREIPKPAVYLIVGMFASLVLSTLFSDYPRIGIAEIGRFGAFCFLVAAIWAFTNSQSRIEAIYIAIIIAGFLTALQILYSFFTTPGAFYYLQVHGFIHEGGIFSNVAAPGGLLCVSIPLSFGYLRMRKEKSSLTGAAGYSIIFIQIAGILLTNSRAAIIGMVAGLAVLFLLSDLKKAMLYSTILFLISLPFFILGNFGELIALFLRSDRILENTRYLLWEISGKVIEQNPIFGIGPGAFKYHMYEFLPVQHGSWDEKQIAWVFENSGAGQQHNFILYRWTELGILGVLTAIAFLVYFFTSTIQQRAAALRTADTKTSIYTARLGIGAGLIVRSIFEATGLITNGWISRDLPFWLLFIALLRAAGYHFRGNDNQGDVAAYG